MTSPTICYCTNVFRSESEADLKRIVAQHAPGLRDALARDALNLGLYLPAALAESLLQRPSDVLDLRLRLQDEGVSCVTLNGFPYGGFHDDRVKETVYQPDWRSPRRAEYTVHLARLLTALLDEAQTSACISTVAGGFAPYFTDQESWQSCADYFAQVILAFRELAELRGVKLVLGLEPEPFTAIERMDACAELFKNTIWPSTATALAKAGVPMAEAETLVQRHLGVCFDTCHQSVVFEDPASAFAALERAGVAIGKLQVSNALSVSHMQKFDQLLRPFNEARYLHQTYLAPSDDSAEVAACLDLVDAFGAIERDGAQSFREGRSHFHVPLTFVGDAKGVGSTRAHLVDTLGEALKREATHLFELETYTWDVMPEALRGESLISDIADEIRWVESWLDQQDE